ncbi:MAG: FAD binding domain-containing protein [Candidatus Omnitrophica bacterium]|nr:FAD binding domain-containing protein [Candidatus Omnitrophota bacterium]
MLLRPLTFHSPRTTIEAAKLQATLGEARILAGGTFLLNSLKLMKRKGSKTPSHVISLRKIEELKGVAIKEDKLIIRAMTIINDLFDSPLLKDNTAILRTVCKNISTNPIRNMATVGGNLTCRYTWTEMGCVMVALEANMHFIDQDGKEEIVQAEDFFKNAAKSDKILSHVSIPIDKSATTVYRRVKKSANVDIPLLAVCIQTHLQNKKFTRTRVTVNNATAFAQRDRKLEDYLNTQSSHVKLGTDALDHLDTEIYDKRSDDYKKHMFRISIKNAIQEIVEKTK